MYVSESGVSVRQCMYLCVSCVRPCPSISPYCLCVCVCVCVCAGGGCILCIHAHMTIFLCRAYLCLFILSADQPRLVRVCVCVCAGVYVGVCVCLCRDKHMCSQILTQTQTHVLCACVTSVCVYGRINVCCVEAVAVGIM
jgi:hypothetical protein